MSRTMKSCFVTLAVLFLWRVEEVAEACSCAPVHPQQAFCGSDVVFRAKVTGKEEVVIGNDPFGNPITEIKYVIKLIKLFKGPSSDIDAVYTPTSSAMCGVYLEADGITHYLITGHLDGGKVRIILCNFIQPWDTLSTNQKLNLIRRYASGCDCTITYCSSIPCMISSPAECLWTDWVTGGGVRGDQARNYACIKRSDGSCSWYRGNAPSKKAFMDIEDP
ncbi:metalloproteinase inhibitor 2b [Kryptolebias marmoratus]|uniref:Metalloproteinase inhibitor 2 n=1 Tax=Kryptolebias marmoratus TaxID=37003 RepID=A0A3Q3FNF4_KRYMA|nr:metalloproteinase inhibitor 2b [Kryptolebias marmoratus]